MANLTRKGLKGFHPRHNTQSAASADRQERSIEKTERQAARAEIRAERRFICPRCDADHCALVNTTVICEECRRLIPSEDLARFRCDAMDLNAVPRVCEDCAEFPEGTQPKLVAKPPVIRRHTEVKRNCCGDTLGPVCFDCPTARPT